MIVRSEREVNGFTISLSHEFDEIDSTSELIEKMQAYLDSALAVIVEEFRWSAVLPPSVWSTRGAGK